MLAFKSAAAVLPKAKRAGYSFSALYSTVSQLARGNWGVVTPAPRSFSRPHGEEEDGDKPLPFDETTGNAERVRSRIDGKPTPEQHKAHRERMKALFPQGWQPPRKLSREAMDGLRALHAHDPETFTTPVLAEKFKVSPEAVRRILRSKWTPSREQRARMIAREREAREQWVKQRRLEERMKQPAAPGPKPVKDRLFLR